MHRFVGLGPFQGAIRVGWLMVAVALSIPVGMSVGQQPTDDSFGNESIGPQGAPQPTDPAEEPAVTPPAEATADDSDDPADVAEPQQSLAENIAARQQQVEQNADLAPEVKESLLKSYQTSLQDLARAEQSANKAAEWRARVEAVPQALETARQRKVNFQPQEANVGEFLSFEEGRSRLQQLERELAAVSERRSKLSEQLTIRTQRTKELPQMISSVREELNSRESATETNGEASDPLVREANQWGRQANLASLRSQLREYQAQQRAIEAEAELLPLQLENAQAEETDLQRRVRAISSELDRIRQDRILSHRAEIYDLRAGVGQPLDAFAAETLELLGQWLELSGKLTELRAEQEKSQATYDRWHLQLDEMRNRVEPQVPGATSPGFNSWVGLMLRKQRAELPDEGQLNSRILHFQEQMQKADALKVEITNSLRTIENLLEQARPSTSAEQQAASQSIALLEKCRSVLIDMRGDVDAYLTELYRAADSRQSMLSLVAEYRMFINEHILWIRSSERLSRGDFEAAWEALHWLVAYENWAQVRDYLFKDFLRLYWLYGLFLILFLALIIYQPGMRRSIGKLGVQSEKKTCVDYGFTIRAAMLTVMVAIPAPLLMLFFAWRLGVAGQWGVDGGDGPSFTLAFAKGLQAGGLVLLPIELLRQVCRSDGLGIRHFGWDPSVTRMLGVNLRWFIDLSMPLLVVIFLFSTQQDSVREASLGRLVFFAFLIVLLIFAMRVLAPTTGLLSPWVNRSQGGWIERLRYFWYGAVIVFPLGLFIATFFGYHYTAQRMVAHVYMTSWSIALLVVFYSLMMRWLVLKRRNLMMEQARQRLVEAARGDSEQTSAAYGTSEVNFSVIGEQTNRLVTSLIVLGGLVLLYFIWSDVFPAIGALENFQLWQVESGDGEVDWITLANLVVVIPVIALVVIADRNLPGLLEIALLQHLPLTAAARYAITTITRYIIIAVGLVIALQALGLRWQSVQWLVAALGVGLGFGLQEIFANFISGLILLFEQPMRVGDIVTVDGVTGKVTRIRMRATTIVNWDRQELVVPNKDFITGKLLNWTLTDSTNRLTITVGVAYGSDTAKACEVIRKVCEEDESLLDDPAPIITFEGFGDNALTIVVRGFLSSLDDRLMVIHRLHQEIYMALSAAEIEIAFPQRDLHVRTLPKQLTDWLTRSGGS